MNKKISELVQKLQEKFKRYDVVINLSHYEDDEEEQDALIILVLKSVNKYVASFNIDNHLVITNFQTIGESWFRVKTLMETIEQVVGE